MKAFVALAIVFGLPAFTWWFCVKVSEWTRAYDYGYVGHVSNLEARKHRKTGKVQYRFKTTEWHDAYSFAETFRPNKIRTILDKP